MRKNENNLEALRHSTEHVLTQAMLKLFPKIKMAMGPATDEGFYFDFDHNGEEISEVDFPKIEAEMEKIIKADLPIKKEEMEIPAAKKLFANNEYKLEWIDEIKKKGKKVSVYWIGEDFVDLCKGPHISSTGKIGAFKLLSMAGAYWHGDEKNKMLTRIYGTAFPTQKELNEYLERRRVAKESDHRKIGQELGLFVFSDLIGKGLPIFGPKGAVIKRELEKFAMEEEIKRGYHHVVTPDLAKVDLYKKSGHYPYYKNTMYPIMKIDEEELILKPMTCPHHFMLYKSQPHSYRELPYRIAEIAHQYRYEKSGELSGLTRVRMFCLADAHIISTKSQAKQVIKEVLELIDYINEKLGMVKGVDYNYRLSLGDRKNSKKYYQDDAAWDIAEDILRQVLVELKAPYFEAADEAAFYGPKIDIQVRKINGAEETAFTVQYDFVMPKRFDLTFTNEDGKEEQPIVIHRSSIGCIERTMAFLIEKYKGNFPTWLTPVQVKVLPITERQLGYAKEIVNKLREEAIRVELDDRNETLGAKIRDAQIEKVSYMLIVGDKEEKEKTVSIRGRSGKDYGQLKLDRFIKNIKEEIASKTI